MNLANGLTIYTAWSLKKEKTLCKKDRQFHILYAIDMPAFFTTENGVWGAVRDINSYNKIVFCEIYHGNNKTLAQIYVPFLDRVETEAIIQINFIGIR